MYTISNITLDRAAVASSSSASTYIETEYSTSFEAYLKQVTARRVHCRACDDFDVVEYLFGPSAASSPRIPIVPSNTKSSSYHIIHTLTNTTRCEDRTEQARAQGVVSLEKTIYYDLPETRYRPRRKMR